MVGEPRLRVGLAQQRTDASISLKGGWRLGGRSVGPVEGLRAQQGAGKVVLTGPDGAELAQAPSVQLEPEQPDSSFVLHKMTVGVDFHWQHEQDLSFYGGLELASRGAADSQGSFDVINDVGLETYLRSVISSEMAATCPDALLRAHAVISRSWLLAMLEGATTAERSATAPTRRQDGVLELVKWYDREDHQHFDVCADDHCQRYQGISRTTTQAASDAVDATRGLVLSHGEAQVVDARFSKACGGMTEVFESAWGDTPVPYLQAFVDHDEPAAFALPLTDERHASAFIDGSPPAFCNCEDKELLKRVLPALDHGTTRFYRWEQTIRSAEIRQFVQTKLGLDLGEIRELQPLVRGPSGRIIRLAIVGDKETLHVGKELEIRKLLSKSHLYSSAFVVRAEGPEGADRQFHLRGAGWGHGVGLCQIGAAVMADRGYTHEAILEHYYRGAKLERRY
jgi:stage II sporulation protein D